MKPFSPKPHNDFSHFIRVYYDECRARYNKISAIAGKWMYRDLIPGLSDFDTRFILNDGMSADDWCELSSVLGEAHLAICERYPCWARNLEHLPGVNLTWSELQDEALYYPEFRQWSFYHNRSPEKLIETYKNWNSRKWDAKDEYYHLKRFTIYHGRYNRTIDVPINCGKNEARYPLHSRLMHYFNPPVNSAVSILLKKHIVGKFDTYDIASEMFPNLRCWDVVQEILHAEYETPKWYEPVSLNLLDDIFEEGLLAIADELGKHITLIFKPESSDPKDWKSKLAEVKVSPQYLIFENAKFARQMKGRLRFYANAPKHFDAKWLIRNELNRIGSFFFDAPLLAYWSMISSDKLEPIKILELLVGSVIEREDSNNALAYYNLAKKNWEEGTERTAAIEIANVFDGFFHCLHKITNTTQQMSEKE